MSKVTFAHSQNPFFKSLKTKVDGYFADNQLHRAGNRKLLLKGSIQVVSALALYTTLVFFTPPPLVALPLCVLMGMNLSLLGFNIMHEGGHQSFSRHAWLNTVSSYFLNILGANTYFWKIKHNINHHTFTNIEGMDSDIDVKPFMRLHENQPHHPMHRFQHFYWVFLYGISYVAWVFYNDFDKYFSGRIAAGAEHKLDRREHIIFWTTKMFYVAMYIGLPIVMVGWLPALIGYAVVMFVCGLSISVVFQLAHVVEGTEFPEPDTNSNKISNEWAVHQITTTANFATRNRTISWLLGGLNFQVEHHLFPRISHIHYPHINKLVKETCREFNVAYLEYPSMRQAFVSHLVHIKKLGVA